MHTSRPAPADAHENLAARRARLEALGSRELAARCLAGIEALGETILGPKARHEELLLELWRERAPAVPEPVEPIPEAHEPIPDAGELLALRRELAQRCAALATLEREHGECGARELALERELEGLRERAAAEPLSNAGDEDALEAAGRALDEIERELGELRRRERWRAAEMQAVAAELSGLQFRLLAPALRARVRGWTEEPR